MKPNRMRGGIELVLVLLAALLLCGCSRESSRPSHDIDRLEHAVTDLERQVDRLQRIDRRPHQVQAVNIYFVRDVDPANRESAEVESAPAESP